jgi:CO/xanthine dehydrogenase FAD-binding subunit
MSDAESLPVPPDLRPLLERHAGIDWARVAMDAVRRRAMLVERAEELARRSKLSAQDARALAEELRGP